MTTSTQSHTLKGVSISQHAKVWHVHTQQIENATNAFRTHTTGCNAPNTIPHFCYTNNEWQIKSHTSIEYNYILRSVYEATYTVFKLHMQIILQYELVELQSAAHVNTHFTGFHSEIIAREGITRLRGFGRGQCTCRRQCVIQIAKFNGAGSISCKGSKCPHPF